MKKRFFLLLATLAIFLFASCAKPNEEPIETWEDDSTDNFWDKGATRGGQMGIARDNNTTINY